MVTLKTHTPCDYPENVCPFMDSSGYVNCEYWCGAEEPVDRSMDEEIEYVMEEQ